MSSALAIKTIVGASPNPSEWTYSDYQDVADAEFRKSGAHAPAVVAVPRNGGLGDNGPKTQLIAYPDSTSASAAYDVLVNAPGQNWYLALYDKAKQPSDPYRVDETYLGGVAVQVPVKKPIWGWFVGLGALGMLGFAVGKRRKYQ